MQNVAPSLFAGGISGYQITAGLKAAIEVGLFSALHDGPQAAAVLAQRTGCAERGARILADYMTVTGYLEKHEGRYRLTPSSAAFLDRHSPAYIGDVADFLASPDVLALMLSDPAANVRAGGSPGLANIAPDNPIWVKFARAMAGWMTPAARLTAARIAAWTPPPARVLDIAAGHGMFGIELARALPQARITAVDWAIVLEVAQENAHKHGVAARYRTLAGSAFEVDFGGGYDLVLLPNFLHHFDPATCGSLLRKIAASLAPGGRVAAVEFVPNEDRVSPPEAAAFAMTMLLTTPLGDAWTQADYAAMARDAGFAGVAAAPLAPGPHTLVEFVR